MLFLRFSNCYATCYKWYNPAVVNNVIKRLGNRRKWANLRHTTMCIVSKQGK